MYAQHGRPDEADEFGDLYARYRPRLVAYCRRRLQSPADAEDAAHEALLRAFQAWGRFDRTQDAWPWLATIAARVCVDMRRRSARPAAPHRQESAADVHDLAVSRLRASIIEDAIDRLPARYRNPLVLKEFAGWSYRDIAELEGASVGAVRSNIMRSRRYLGARIETVARGRGQWPLPVAVPGVGQRLRHRARTWREALFRLVDPAIVMTGLAFAMQPASVGASTVAAAVVAAGVLGAPQVASAATEQATPTTAVKSSAAVPLPSTELGQVPTGPTGVGSVAAARETLTRIENQPVESSYVWARASASVQAAEPTMWVAVDVRYGAPVVGEGRFWTTPNVPCGKSDNHAQREACRTASDALRPLPD